MDTTRRTLLSASLGTLVAMIAFTAPLSTVNPTVAGLDAGVAGRTWILSSMSIGLGAFLLTAGRVADDYGRRRTFVAGALLSLVFRNREMLARHPYYGWKQQAAPTQKWGRVQR